ncbi:MAG: hypothetical protein II702_06695 [Clostridia bacterium]|nr:hypothetical protein [Clostridia bacterium]MBQ4244584.1 hypothetical protein [Clostridia bacterium]
MNKKLVNSKTYTPACAYCLHGRLSPGGVSVLCVRKGIVSPEGKCRKFVYDPLKREPKIPPVSPEADAKDFEF